VNGTVPVLVALASLTSGCSSGTTGTRPEGSMSATSDRQILIMATDSDMGRLDLRGARSGVYRQTRRYPGLPSDLARHMKALAAEHGLVQVDHWPMLNLGVQCFVFVAPTQAGIDELIGRLDADPRVESAQRMNRFELQASSRAATWDDPYRDLQPSLDALEVTEAHRQSTGRGVRIAVIDTGIASSHPELAGQVAERRDFVGGTGAGDRHGTAMAGVMVSRAGNRQGIVGIAPDARVLALRACEQREAAGKGSCTTFDLARALDYAIAARADVVNLSLGGPRDPLLERLLGQAIAGGVVVITAAGEDAPFPAVVEGVIAVSGEASKAHARALAAPGSNVLSLAPPDAYDYFSGSSIAAAQVSAIVALLLERAPQLRASDIRPLLARTARPAARPGEEPQLQVNACTALADVGAAVNCTAGAGRERAADSRASLPTLETH